jgi:hypothetical protein
MNGSNEWGNATIWPDKLVVGQHGTWMITYIVGQHSIGEEGTIRIRPYGNPLVRPPGQTIMTAEENYVTVKARSEAIVKIECSVWLVVTVTVLKGRLVEGDEITVVYGDKSEGSPGLKLRAVVYDQHFRVSIKRSAEDEGVALPERPLLRLVPDAPAKILVKASSMVASDEDVDLLLHCVDQFGNTVDQYGAPLHLSAIQGLDMPDVVHLDSVKGAYTTIRCHRAGELPVERVRIAVRDNTGKVVARSNPIEVNASKEKDRIFWGDLHCHTNLEQGLESLEFLYEYARDQEKLDFVANVEHQWGTRSRWVGKPAKTWKGGMSVPAYNEDSWESRKELVRKYDEPGRCVTLLGLEWASNIYGHANIYYPALEGPLFYPSWPFDREETPAKLWQALEGRDAIIIPHHPSSPVGTGEPPNYWATSGYDWDFWDEKLIRVVEIYSKWGCSEYFGCRRPLLNQQEDGCVQTALAKGHKLGFVAGTDSQTSRAGSDQYQDHTYRQGGLTAVFAPSLDRASIYQAVKARRCYATTGQRIILRFSLNGHFMGEEVQLEDPAEIKKMHVEVATVGDIDTVEVLKNGIPFYRYNGHLAPDLGWWRDNGWEMEVRVQDKEITRGTDYYYVCVLQQDGEMAWSSPIWVSAKAGVN